MYGKKSSIYSIYGWMGVVGKYTGCFPLPGLYEKREWSKWTNPFINYLIPALNFSLLIFCFVAVSLQYRHSKSYDLTEMLLYIIDMCSFGHSLTCAFFNHFVLRRKLVSYLKLHLRVEDLLEPTKSKLKSFVSIFFVLITTYNAVHIGLFTNGYFINDFYRNFNADPIQTIKDCSTRLMFSYALSLALGTNPYLMYILFQRILKSSFDQLLEKIKKNQAKFLSCEMRVRKMRKYMKLYCDLCEISARLDDLVSPLMITIFLAFYLKVIYSLAYITSNFSVFSLSNAFTIVTGIFPLILVSDFAYFTKKSRDAILPAIYSTFDFQEKAVRTELQNFALQSMHLNKSFSASGFFKLDRELILAIIQSLISQAVTFNKMSQGKTDQLIASL